MKIAGRDGRNPSSPWGCQPPPTKPPRSESMHFPLPQFIERGFEPCVLAFELVILAPATFGVVLGVLQIALGLRKLCRELAIFLFRPLEFTLQLPEFPRTRGLPGRLLG